jgi:hypothetical protein
LVVGKAAAMFSNDARSGRVLGEIDCNPHAPLQSRCRLRRNSIVFSR